MQEQSSTEQELPYLLSVKPSGNTPERFSWSLTKGYEKIAQGVTLEKDSHRYIAAASVLHMDRDTLIYVDDDIVRNLLIDNGFTNIPSKQENDVLQRGFRDHITRITVAAGEYFDAVEKTIEQQKSVETKADRKNAKLPRLTVATDASMSVGVGDIAGISWIAEDGRHSINLVKVAVDDICAAELWAIYSVLGSFQRKRKLLINSDSRQAISAIENRKKNLSRRDKHSPAKIAALEAIDREIEGRDIVFEWVRGHDGHALNETADGLAKVSRHSYERQYTEDQKWEKVNQIILAGIGFDNHTKNFISTPEEETAA